MKRIDVNVIEGWGQDHNGTWHAATTRFHTASVFFRAECSGGILRIIVHEKPRGVKICPQCTGVLVDRILHDNQEEAR